MNADAAINLEDLNRSDELVSYVSKTGSVRSFNSLNDDLAEFLKREIGRLEDVDSVRVSFLEQDDLTVVHVCTTLLTDGRGIRQQIYEKEERLMEHFQDELFDFHVHLA